MKKTHKKIVNKKRKTKRMNKMKKRIKKGGEGESEIFKLYSEVYHKRQNNYIRRNVRPIYNFTGEKKRRRFFCECLPRYYSMF